MQYAPLAACLLGLLVLNAPGCGAAADTTTVHGAVTYREEPVAGGMITFYPRGGGPLMAPLSAGGEYQLALPPGEYTVTVNPSSAPPPGFKEGDPLPPPQEGLPREYTSRARSQLSATIPRTSPHHRDFPLE